MSKLLLRKAGGYSMLAGLLGGFYYMAGSNIGYLQAALVMAGSVVFFAWCQLAIYLIME
jgi:hypothetical protein